MRMTTLFRRHGSLLMLLFVLSTEAAAQSVFLVRHAERADTAGGAPATMAADPDLSPAGRARAESLAGMLKDAGITAIFTTEFKRTQQTAAPLAKALKIEPTIVPSKDAADLARRVAATSGNVLVVGHSNTVPDLIKALGIGTPVTIDDAAFDNLYVVTRGAKPVLIHLHYR
jgi:broad specificity phosphatase PhoE